MHTRANVTESMSVSVRAGCRVAMWRYAQWKYVTNANAREDHGGMKRGEPRNGNGQHACEPEAPRGRSQTTRPRARANTFKYGKHRSARGQTHAGPRAAAAKPRGEAKDLGPVLHPSAPLHARTHASAGAHTCGGRTKRAASMGSTARLLAALILALGSAMAADERWARTRAGGGGGVAFPCVINAEVEEVSVTFLPDMVKGGVWPPPRNGSPPWFYENHTTKNNTADVAFRTSVSRIIREGHKGNKRQESGSGKGKARA